MGVVVGVTRIASVSGLRGIVGNGLDPATAVEFAAAYARRASAICLGDRASSSRASPSSTDPHSR